VNDQEAVHFHSTPPIVAERMASLLRSALEDGQPRVRLLDPGVGEGALSVAAAGALAESGCEVAVTGIDVSSELLGAAEANLSAARVQASLHKSDFLRESNLNGFDAAICNPPYGKRSQAELGEGILLEYKEAISGHPNLFALFIHKIIRALRPGGVCVIICPKSLMSGPYFHALRRFLLEQGSIENLLLFDQRFGLFEGVLQGVFVFQFRKGALQGECTVHRVISSEGEDRWVIDTPYAEGDEFAQRIIPGSSASNRELLLKALHYPVSIADRFPVETGPLVWFRHRDRLLRTSAAEDAIPIIWSDQIEQGYISPGRRPDRLRSAGMNRFALTQSKLGPALVTKRVTAPEEERRLVAGLTASPLWSRPVIYENHTNVIRSKGGDIDELVRLELLFGTDLYDDLLRALSHNTQVGAADLRILPFVQLPLEEGEREAVLKAAEEGMALPELLDLGKVGDRLLEVLSASNFGDPDIAANGNVVHLTLPFGEPASGSIDGRKPVDA
jgi:SAM-dependent methyltransferase